MSVESGAVEACEMALQQYRQACDSAIASSAAGGGGGDEYARVESEMQSALRSLELLTRAYGSSSGARLAFIRLRAEAVKTTHVFYTHISWMNKQRQRRQQ